MNGEGQGSFPDLGDKFRDVLDTAIQGSADLQNFTAKFDYDPMFKRSEGAGSVGRIEGLYGADSGGNVSGANPYMKDYDGWRDTPGKNMDPEMNNLSDPQAVISQMREVNAEYIDSQKQYTNLSIKLQTTSAIAEVTSNFVKSFRTLFQGQ